MNERIYENQGIRLQYYEVQNNFQPLVLIHAQGVDGQSYVIFGRFDRRIHCRRDRTL